MQSADIDGQGVTPQCRFEPCVAFSCPTRVRTAPQCDATLHLKIGGGVSGPLKAGRAGVAQRIEHLPTEQGLWGFESLHQYQRQGPYLVASR